jgi:hypothetical protein
MQEQCSFSRKLFDFFNDDVKWFLLFYWLNPYIHQLNTSISILSIIQEMKPIWQYKRSINPNHKIANISTTTNDTFLKLKYSVTTTTISPPIKFHHQSLCIISLNSKICKSTMPSIITINLVIKITQKLHEIHF